MTTTKAAKQDLGESQSVQGKRNEDYIGHTPGNWELVDNNEVHAKHSGRKWLVAEVYGKDLKTKRANARLIAAAPELLEACKRAFHVFENDTPRKREVMAMFESAIAKVERNQS